MSRRSPLKIGFFGLPLAALLLERDDHAIEWAVLSPLELPGRRRVTHSLSSKGRLVDLLLDSASWQTQVEHLVERHPVDLIVSWFFTRRILATWLGAAPLGAIGVHPSLLPRHRGPDPFYAVIDAGEPFTGVTVHRLAAEYDTGAILAQRSLEVGPRNAWQLARALDRPSLAALRETVSDFSRGTLPLAIDQDEQLVTWAPLPSGDALRVDWQWPTDRILRRIRAISPEPGLLLELNETEFAVLDAAPTDDYPSALAPGEAFLGRRLVLRTGTGAITVEKATIPEGEEGFLTCDGRRLADFLRGKENRAPVVDF